MNKTEFMCLYEELTFLNESAAENFTRLLEKRFDKIKPQLDDIVSDLYISNKFGGAETINWQLNYWFSNM